MVKKLFYTGVGSRVTPKAILETMTLIAIKLSKSGYILRSGGAIGADQAFERGSALHHIFHARDANMAAMAIAGGLHPAWDRCSQYAKRLHGRNAFQVLGLELDQPSKFLICWTPDGCESHASRTYETGGTGTAISIASEHGVPVFNLANQITLKRLEKFLDK